LKIKPFLVPVFKGAATYHKVLMITKSSRVNLDSVDHYSLAMTSVGPDSKAFLNQILFQNHDEKMALFRSVIVPKSTDALFALFLGHVDSALVVQEHLETFEKMLPRIIGGVRPLLLSKPIPMPMLCYSKVRVAQTEINTFKTVLLGEKNKAIRNNLNELLQIDGWHETAE
jgi:hypothetical protein